MGVNISIQFPPAAYEMKAGDFFKLHRNLFSAAGSVDAVDVIMTAWLVDSAGRRYGAAIREQLPRFWRFDFDCEPPDEKETHQEEALFTLVVEAKDNTTGVITRRSVPFIYVPPHDEEQEQEAMPASAERT